MKFVLGFSFLMMAPSAGADEVLDILNGKGATATSQEFIQVKSRMVSKYLTNPSAEQNIFFEFLGAGEYEKALVQWSTAFRGASFRTQPNGVGLYAFILLKNGLTMNALEHLFRISDPGAMDSELQNLIRLEAGPRLKEWGLAKLKWTPQWDKVFSQEIKIKVLASQEIDVRDHERIFELLKASQVGSPEREELQWQMALSLILTDQGEKAAQLLSHLLKSKLQVVDANLIRLTIARLLFERGHLKAAAQYFQKIPKSSDYWFVAQEEAAWAHIRMGQPQNTLAITQGLVLPEFDLYIGPETVFLRALSNLKVCDYPEAAKALDYFRIQFRPRAESLQELTKTGSTEAGVKLLETLKGSASGLKALGSAAKLLPRFSLRDRFLRRNALEVAALDSEVKKVEELYFKSLSAGSGKVGFEKSVLDLKTQIEDRRQSAKIAFFNRIKKLAGFELEEIHQILQKMHIVEAELIQQVSQLEKVKLATQKSKAKLQKGTTGSQGGDLMKFPFEGELWFDEISNYKIDLKKGCLAKGSSGVGG